MKRVAIQENYVGLTFKGGELTNVLTAGKYWVGFGETVEIHNMSLPFLPKQELNVLLKNEALTALLQIADIQDNEIGLLYRDGRFAETLGPGRFAFWKGATDYVCVKKDITQAETAAAIDKILLERSQLSNFVRAFKVDAHEQGILFIDGKMERILTPGTYYFWKNSQTIVVQKADMRQMGFDLSGQEVLTKDKAALRANFTIRYKVTDIVKALVENREFEKQLYTLTQLALREMIGKMSFDELMENKDQVADQVLAETVEKATALGVAVSDFGLKDIVLPGDMRDIMNQVLIAEKRAQANIITRREETASMRSLLNTAKLMEENAMLFKLKEMEYVEKIAEKIQTISLSNGGQVVDQLKTLFIK